MQIGHKICFRIINKNYGWNKINWMLHPLEVIKVIYKNNNFAKSKSDQTTTKGGNGWLP